MYRPNQYYFLSPLRQCAVLGLIFIFYAAELSAKTVTASQLYQKNCSACHGERGNGKARASRALNPPPRDFTQPGLAEGLSRERMINSVTYGRPDTAMVGWQGRLSPGEIENIVDFVREQFMQPPKPVSADPRLGRRIYLKHCSACHGDKGNGATWTKNSLNPPPRDFTALDARNNLSHERMINSVTFGRAGTAMMPFTSRLNAEEIKSVVGYIRYAFIEGKQLPKTNGDNKAAVHRQNPHAIPDNNPPGKIPEKPIKPVNMALLLPHGLKGDKKQGRDFYMNNCITCHGKKGDGKGPRADFNYPRPRNFLSVESRKTLNRPALFRAISQGKPGSVMPAWQAVLTAQQIADVTEFVYTEFTHPAVKQSAGKPKKKRN